MNKLPFEITNKIIDNIAEVAELIGKITVTARLSGNPVLCRKKPYQYGLQLTCYRK